MVAFRRRAHLIKAFELIYPFGIKFRSAICGLPTRDGRQKTFLLSCSPAPAVREASDRRPVRPAAASAVVAGGGSVNGAQCD